ncbi:MAG TPA: glycosyltransferase, partial [Thermodesulfobacteriota bacterium]|nr:glycosyltransferase [Thermodesulfobacteriota bacterium]
MHGKRFLLEGEPWVVRGVSYGPFRPGDDGVPFPPPPRLEQDLAAIAALGANVLRVYHVPPPEVADAAALAGLRLLVGLPWAQHVAFLDGARWRREIRRSVAAAARTLRDHPARLAYVVGNEIPPAAVRWYGRRRVERFLGELVAAVRDADPDALVTYGNFPTTEYLDPPDQDFVTFNVYLHDDGAFRRYLARLLNLAGERPLVLGELGFDSIREGEAAQAERLAAQIRLALDEGAAGVVAYTWTDEWHTGGAEITDWAFGLVDRERRPKPAYRAVRQAYRRAEPLWPAPAPRVSVVVCAYNAEATLGACLDALRRLRYPDFEVIVVDDGSTDRTGPLAEAAQAADPRVRVIRHERNRGLSAARNTGLAAATGTIVAYTDADCVVDPDWLARLARAFAATGAAAVGGPNLPEVGDSPRAACIAAAPGWPTHVLLDDEVAEHIPGCNMAFRREALAEIGGFDPLYTAAGDDVDVCWKLAARGRTIAFAPAAFVWHLARRSLRAYLRQQRGYGRAEALLFPRHPERFNGWRSPCWAGTIYHRGSPRATWGREWVYHGPFGTAPYQLLYGAPPGGPAHLPATLEWQAAALLILLLGLATTPWLALPGAAALVLSVARAVRFAGRARLP